MGKLNLAFLVASSVHMMYLMCNIQSVTSIYLYRGLMHIIWLLSNTHFTSCHMLNSIMDRTLD